MGDAGEQSPRNLDRKGAGSVKRLKLAAYRLMRALGVFAVARVVTRRRLRILCYHGTWRGDPAFGGDSLFIRAETFGRRLDLLQRRGYAVLPLDEALERLAEGRLPANAVAITIDDGWYGTYADMVPALAARGMPATLYCDTASLMSGTPVPHVMARYLRRIHRGEGRLGAEEQALYDRATDLSSPREARLEAALAFARRIGADADGTVAARAFGYMTPGELRAARKAGLDVQLHTHTHSFRDFSDFAIAEEIRLNRETLAAVLEEDPATFRHLCFPSGVCRVSAARAIAAAGVTSATTLEPRAARADDHPLFLPRLMDGEHLTNAEFEAELCGVAELLRAWRGTTSPSRQAKAVAAVS
jgi:peptidoglycan/xylan/chitin deacetylase (PgdA/CDA1 family)